MTEWEYKVTNHYPSDFEDVVNTPSEVESSINRMGEDGWELVSVSSSKIYLKHQFIFKRPKTD